MTEELGIVDSTDGKMAIVKVPRKSACDGCKLGTCKQDDQSMEIEAFNEADAQIGQKVKVKIRSYTYVKGSILIYGIPAVALVVGAVLGKEIFSSFFPEMDSDIVSSIFGFGALGLSFIIIRIWMNFSTKKLENKPVIEEILIE